MHDEKSVTEKRYSPNAGAALAKAYEVELGLMADVRAYFDVAFQVRIGLAVIRSYDSS